MELCCQPRRHRLELVLLCGAILSGVQLGARRDDTFSQRLRRTAHMIRKLERGPNVPLTSSGNRGCVRSFMLTSMNLEVIIDYSRLKINRTVLVRRDQCLLPVELQAAPHSDNRRQSATSNCYESSPRALQ